MDIHCQRELSFTGGIVVVHTLIFAPSEEGGGRSAQKRKLDPAATRERIENAAVREFARKGVEGASIADIARRAGVADGALYRHYPSKEELVRALFARNYEALAHTLGALEQREDDLPGKLGAIVRAVYGLFDADPDMYRFLLLNQFMGMSGVGADSATPVDLIIELLADAMNRGEIPRQDPAMAAAQTFGVVLQPTVFAVYERLKPPMSAYAAEVTRACLRALGHADAGE
jgi:AcrR family transcriptional regulator